MFPERCSAAWIPERWGTGEVVATDRVGSGTVVGRRGEGGWTMVTTVTTTAGAARMEPVAAGG